jgi:glycosyltransferase involved in cell wall biosynthesis
MDILVGNNTLANLGGSETYAYAFILELIKLGHNVEAFTGTNLGLVANKLKDLGVNCNITPSKKEYDVIFTSHTSTIYKIKNIEGLKIQTCHGVYHPLERPGNFIDKYVSISKEVYDSLITHNLNSTIIYNGIDCDRFKPVKTINNKLTKVLSLSQSEEVNSLIRKACEKLGITFIAHNKFINPVFNIEDVINEVDLVVSLGRGTYEAMACGRPVLILDKRPYINKPPIGDGLITPENIDLFIQNNCSGRYSNNVYNIDDIINEFLKYEVSLGQFSRNFALKELNIQTQVQKYLSLI